MNSALPDCRIVRAEPARLPVLAGVLGRALKRDPIFNWSLGGHTTVQAVTDLALALYERYAELGMMWEGGDAAGVAVWMPPRRAAGLAAANQAVVPVPVGMLAQRERQQRMWDWLDSYVDDDVWYLEVLGVDPVRQRSGVGTALTRHGLDLAHADGKDAFLETSVADNVPYYIRLGFEVVNEGDPSEGGPHVWFMRCTP